MNDSCIKIDVISIKLLVHIITIFNDTPPGYTIHIYAVFEIRVRRHWYLPTNG